LLKEIGIVTRRQDDGEDVTVERLSEPHGKDLVLAQFGAFAARDLPDCTIFASYTRGATISPEDEERRTHLLREFDFEVRLCDSAYVVINGNPLMSSAAMINDPRGSDKVANAQFFVILKVSPDGSLELHLLLQTIQWVRAGAELLVDYGDTFWKPWDEQREATRVMRLAIILEMLQESKHFRNA
jgi:hypothetical protein